jgi:hypothetical protein
MATNPVRLTTSNSIFPVNTFFYIPYVTSSLTRGWVSCFQLVLALSSAVILGSESSRTHDRILLSQIRDSANLGDQVLVLISSRIRVVQLYPQSLEFSFPRLLRLAGLPLCTYQVETAVSNSSSIIVVQLLLIKNLLLGNGRRSVVLFRDLLLETNVVSEPFAINGCFCGFTVLASSKYATIYIRISSG